MTILIFSQNIYPKKIVLDYDTVVVISEEQLIKINSEFAYNEYLENALDLKINQVYSLDSLCHRKDNLLDTMIIIARNQNTTLNDLSKKNINTEKLLIKEKRKVKFSFITGSILTLIALILIK